MATKEYRELLQAISSLGESERITVANEDDIGLFDYTDLEKEDREQRWMVLAYCIEQKKITDVGILFERNPFFFDWYKRNILSDVPVNETCH